MDRRNRRAVLTLAAVALVALLAGLAVAGRHGAPAPLAPLGRALGVVCMEYPPADLPPDVCAFPREVPCPPAVYLLELGARVVQALPAGGQVGPPTGALLAGLLGLLVGCLVAGGVGLILAGRASR